VSEFRNFCSMMFVYGQVTQLILIPVTHIQSFEIHWFAQPLTQSFLGESYYSRRKIAGYTNAFKIYLHHVSLYLRHQRRVASRHGKRVDPKAHRYVEYRQTRNSWNKPAVNKWCGNENFGDECKSLLYFYLHFAPLKGFNARDIYRDSLIHVRLKITRFKRKFID